MSDRTKNKGPDLAMAEFMASIRRKYSPQVKSNPIPSRPTYEWCTDIQGNMVGVREGCAPIVITATTPAPIRKITHDRGTIVRTLADGAGAVVLPGPRKTKPKAKGWNALISPRRVKGATVKHTPSWKQEVRGRVDWRELVLPGRHETTVFDLGCGGKGDPKPCSISHSGIKVLPACWDDRQELGPVMYPARIPGLVTG